MQDPKSNLSITTTITKAGSSSQLSVLLALITLAQFMVVEMRARGLSQTEIAHERQAKASISSDMQYLRNQALT
jgi:hypothetical protein